MLELFYFVCLGNVLTVGSSRLQYDYQRRVSEKVMLYSVRTKVRNMFNFVFNIKQRQKIHSSSTSNPNISIFSGFSELLGILVGHLYFFLMFKYPQDFGGQQWLFTPQIL